MAHTITTAIPYVNGPPHMGHALEIVLADVFARFGRVLGKKVSLQTGSDEHGKKNFITAKKAGKEIKEIKEFLDENVFCFKELYEALGISYTSFVRTSNPDHYEGVKKIWCELRDKECIYKDNFRGRYCVGCEAFKPEHEDQGQEHPTLTLELVEESNYFFCLSRFGPALKEIYEQRKIQIIPQRSGEINNWLSNLKDISISRPRNSVHWGIPVPEDDSQLIYVWFDALPNYLTGGNWPADLQIIGKDILRFHTIIWPAMLIALNMPLPKEILVHGFITVNGTKMGKSNGNVIDPVKKLREIGSDPLRYALMASCTLNEDCNYNEDVINAELINNIANFCHRSLSLLVKNHQFKVGKLPIEIPIKKDFEFFLGKIREAYDHRDIRSILVEIQNIAYISNKFLTDSFAWRNGENAPNTLAICINMVRNLTILIEPICPYFSRKIMKQLNLPEEFTWAHLGFDLENHLINQPQIILRRK